MKILALVALMVTGLGCVTSIKNVDTTGADPVGVRTCANTYSQCAGGAPAIAGTVQALNACAESYQVCVNTYKK